MLQFIQKAFSRIARKPILLAGFAAFSSGLALQADPTDPYAETAATPAAVKVSAKQHLHGLGGKVHSATTDRLLTDAKYQTFLKQPTANPHLILRRADLGVKIHPNAMKFIAPPAKTMSLHSGMSSSPTPSMVDWRNRWGINWISAVENQGGTENCWAFCTNGLIESMVRIEHGVWCRRSVVEIRKGVGKTINDGGNSHEALTWVENHGIADPDCSPYTEDSKPLQSTPDRSGRTVKIAKHVRIPNDANQASAKRWLDTHGPLTINGYKVYTDFDSLTTQIYRSVSKSATLRGSHCLLIVGYDDVNKCWICKNSWGADWGDKGFCRIGYGVADIDKDEKYGVSGTSPDPWTKQGMHNGIIFESGNGAAHRNFEALVTGGTNDRQLAHWWRQGGENGDFGWHFDKSFGNDAAACPTITATTYNRNFESVHLTYGNRLHHWFFDQASKKWGDGGVFGPTDAVGVPGFVQGNAGAPGNLEVTVPVRGGKIAHWWRLNGSPWTWRESARFGANIAFCGPTLIHERAGQPGNLHLVAVLNNGKMQMWNRNTNAANDWKADPVLFGNGVSSPPCMIQGQFGNWSADYVNGKLVPGNYEMCVAVGGKVQHWGRDIYRNAPWNMTATFGHDIQAVIGLVEGSFGFDLEVIVLRKDKKMQHYWRQGTNWHEGAIIGGT